MVDKIFIFRLVTSFIVLPNIYKIATVTAKISTIPSSYCSEGYGFNLTAGDHKCYPCASPAPNPDKKPCLDCAEDITVCKKCINYMGVTAQGGCGYCPLNRVRCNLSNNTCLECQPGCILNSYGQCKSCNYSYALTDERPCLNSATYGNCTACPSGTGLDAKTGGCRRCHYGLLGCTECSQDYTICSECHLTQADGSCVRNCENLLRGCAECYLAGNNPLCSKCYSWYALINGSCVKCSNNCADCRATGNDTYPVECHTCEPWAIKDPRNPGKCFSCGSFCDINHCSLIDDKPYCSKCREDLYQKTWAVEGKCKKLPPGCAQLAYKVHTNGERSLICTKCTDDYNLNNGHCTQMNCKTINCAHCDPIRKGCLKCKIGYYLLEDACIACPKHCKSCYYSLKAGRPLCTSCLSGDYASVLVDGLCYAANLKGCKTAIWKDGKAVCTQCIGENQYVLLDNGTCGLCGGACKSCLKINNKPVCQECYFGNLDQDGRCSTSLCRETIPGCVQCQDKVEGANRRLVCQYCRCKENACYAPNEEGTACTRRCTPCIVELKSYNAEFQCCL